MDLGGFWICCCRKGTTSFGTKFTSMPIISGFNYSTARLLANVLQQ